MNIKKRIEQIIKNETFEGFSSIQDRFLNGDCESLAILLLEADSNGEIIKIRQNNNGSIFNHYIYKRNELFYDINGEFYSIKELMAKIDYFDVKKEYSIIN